MHVCVWGLCVFGCVFVCALCMFVGGLCMLGFMPCVFMFMSVCAVCMFVYGECACLDVCVVCGDCSC